MADIPSKLEAPAYCDSAEDIEALRAFYIRLPAWEIYEAALLLIGHLHGYPERLWHTDMRIIYEAAKRAIIAGCLDGTISQAEYCVFAWPIAEPDPESPEEYRIVGTTVNAIEEMMAKAHKWFHVSMARHDMAEWIQKTWLTAYHVKPGDFIFWAKTQGYEIPAPLETLLPAPAISYQGQALLLRLVREKSSENKRITRDALADHLQELTGSDFTNGESIRDAIDCLKAANLIRAKTGPNGGYWATPQGYALADRILHSRQQSTE